MKKTQIDRAIDGLEAKRRVLEMAIMELREQQARKPARKPKAKPFDEMERAR